MCNRDRKVLICVDIQPGFVTPEGELTVPRDPAALAAAWDRTLDLLYGWVDEFLLRNRSLIEAIGKLELEPEPDLFHLYYADALGRPASSEVANSSGDVDIERLWPRHCVKGTKTS